MERSVKYLVIIYGNRDLWESFPAEEWPREIAAQDAFNDAHRASGELLGAFGLASEQLAKTVRVREGMPIVTDGPYVEAKEYVSSFFLLECEDEAHALELAAKVPFAARNAVEVRQVLHEAG
jgi:hypothetical protein